MMDESNIIDTYKSIWYQDKETGNYVRVQKKTYPFEKYLTPFEPVLSRIPLVRGG
jgi:hypothetical protein